MLIPGDVVITNFVGVQQSKIRPAIVISTDLYQSTCPDVVIAILTTNIAAASRPTDYVLQDWASAGLRKESAFRVFLRTEPAGIIIRKVGSLSPRDWQEVQARLRSALAVA